MAFQFDGSGYIQLPQWGSGTGDFTITGSFVYPSSGAFECMLGDVSGSNFLFYADTGNTVKLKISSTVTLTGFVAGTEYPFTISRSGSIITITCNGQSPTIGFGGTNVPWDQFGAFGSAHSSKFTGKLSGIWSFVSSSEADRDYNFNQPIGTADLPETTSGQDGALTGFVTGDYDGVGADSITIDSLSDGDFLQRQNSNNERLVTVSGSNIGTLPATVEYRLDYGNWTLLDASPTSTYSGDITITGKQLLQVRGTTVDTVSSIINITIGVGVVAFWQSNEQGYGINTQPVELGADKPVPLMYDGTNFVTLVDPVATVAGFGGSGGSTWPRIAKLYSDKGCYFCVYNIAKGGSLISEWQKPGVNYDKIAPFVTKIGGLEFATCIGGENDAQNGITQLDMETQLTQLVTDINTDFGCDTYVCKFPMKQPAANVATVFAAYDAVIANLSFAKAGGDLSVIDIEVATAPGNDAVHLKQDADLTTAANIRFAAQQAGMVESSTANLSISGIPDGSFTTVIDDDNGNRLFRGSLTYSSESSSQLLPIASGSRFKGYVDDNLNPSIDGAYIEGLTS